MIKITISQSVSAAILSSLRGRIPEALRRLEQAVVESCDPFVPYRTGELCRSAVIGDGIVTYTAPHASECYYASRNFSRKYHPHACARWFEAAKSTDIAKWQSVVEDSLTGAGTAGGGR